MKGEINITNRQLDDLISCVHYTLDNFPKEGATNFLSSIETIKKKLWKELRTRSKKKELGE